MNRNNLFGLIIYLSLVLFTLTSLSSFALACDDYSDEEICSNYFNESISCDELLVCVNGNNTINVTCTEFMDVYCLNFFDNESEESADDDEGNDDGSDDGFVDENGDTENDGGDDNASEEENSDAEEDDATEEDNASEDDNSDVDDGDADEESEDAIEEGNNNDDESDNDDLISSPDVVIGDNSVNTLVVLARPIQDPVQETITKIVKTSSLHIHAGGKHIADKKNDKLSYIHSNFQGSVVLLTNEDGGVYWEATYDPFGNVNFESRAKSQVYTYTDEQYDDTGFYYYGARYYDPTLGIFLTPDSVELLPNPYSYVKNNPLRYVDPTGLETEGWHTNSNGERYYQLPDLTVYASRNPSSTDSTYIYSKLNFLAGVQNTLSRFPDGTKATLVADISGKIPYTMGIGKAKLGMSIDMGTNPNGPYGVFRLTPKLTAGYDSMGTSLKVDFSVVCADCTFFDPNGNVWNIDYYDFDLTPSAGLSMISMPPTTVHGLDQWMQGKAQSIISDLVTETFGIKNYLPKITYSPVFFDANDGFQMLHFNEVGNFLNDHLIMRFSLPREYPPPNVRQTPTSFDPYDMYK